MYKTSNTIKLFLAQIRIQGGYSKLAVELLLTGSILWPHYAWCRHLHPASRVGMEDHGGSIHAS